MLENLVRTASALLKSALVVLAGGTAVEQVPTAPAGVIHDIDPGDGPTWGTLSGLTAHQTDPSRLYAVTDRNSSPIRIVEIRLATGSAKVTRQIDVVAPGFDELDTEGIGAKPDGGFWLASEGGAGNVPPNVLLEVNAAGQLLRSIHLPNSIAARMPKKGIEGIALDQKATGSHLYVAFQAPIDGDPADLARIGVVDLETEAWSFYYYPLDRSASGDLTGLSELLHLGGGKFAAIERDGKGGRQSIKWLTTFELGSVAGSAADEAPPTLKKRRAVDLVPLFLNTGRKVEKEIEGLALAVDGEVYAVTDNDNRRATLLLRLGKAETLF